MAKARSRRKKPRTAMARSSGSPVRPVGTYSTLSVKDRMVVGADLEDRQEETLRVAGTVAVQNQLACAGDLAVEGKLTVKGRAVIPRGAIMMWHSISKDPVPDGWAICDGKNGTPDLRDRFIVAAGGAYKAGDKGGEDAVTLTVNQMPPHTHPNSRSDETGSHRHKFTITEHGWAFACAQSGDKRRQPRDLHTDWQGQHSHALHITADGGGKAHENRPRYFAVVFIMRTA